MLSLEIVSFARGAFVRRTIDDKVMQVRDRLDVKEELVVGRNPAQSDISVVEDGVSRRHCVFKSCEGGDRLSVLDLESSNGTFVNGAPCGSSERLLNNGDIIVISSTNALILRCCLSARSAAQETIIKGHDESVE